MSSGVRRRVWALTLLALGAVAQPAAASHFRYGTLSWAPIRDANGQFAGDVEFRLTASFERAGAFANVVTGQIIQESIGGTALAYGDGQFSQPLFFLITAHSVSEQWIIGEALNQDPNVPVPGPNDVGLRHTYTGQGPFLAYLVAPAGPPPDFPGCCRILPPTLANRGNWPYPLPTLVSPLSGNSSPVSAMVPVVVVPPSATATFQVPAVDPDGDPIRWRFSSNAEAVGSVTPNPPFGDPGLPPGVFTIDSTTGVVTWNNLGVAQAPTFWTVQFMIEDLDANGNPKTKTPVDFLLQIRPVVGARPSCSISPPGPLIVSPGVPLSLTVTGTDPDLGSGDSVTLNSGGLPALAGVTPALPFTAPQGANAVAVVSWTPGAGDVGTQVLLFSATDGAGQQGLCQTTVTVPAVSNTAPRCTIGSHPSQVAVGGLLSFDVTGEDSDAGDTVTLDAIAVPAGSTLTPVLPISGDSPQMTRFDWTPALGQQGPHEIAFSVTDGAGGESSCRTTVEVVSNSNPPTCAISPQPAQALAGIPLSLTVTGTDLDPSDIIMLDALTIPGGATVNPPLPVTGSSPQIAVLSWTPTAQQRGPNSINFSVTDGAGHVGACPITIDVIATPPSCSISPPPPSQVLPGTPVAFTVTANDTDAGDTVTLTGVALPQGASLNPPTATGTPPVTAQFTWTPLLGQVGTHTMSFTTTDAAGLNSTCSAQVEVVQHPPSCLVVPASQTVLAGSHATFMFTATDPDVGLGDLVTVSSTALPSGATLTPPLPNAGVPSVSSQFDWTPLLNEVGQHSITFTVTDRAGQPTSCTAQVDVVERPPTCVVDPPTQAVAVGSLATFTVAATDPDAGDTITLTSAPLPFGAALTPPLPITGTPPPPVTTQFSWTPNGSQVGTHTINFTATDRAGQTGSCQGAVVVINTPPTITCPGPLTFQGCNISGGQEVTLTVHVADANGDALTVTWQVDGVTVETDIVPSGGATTSADVTLVHVLTLGSHVVTVTVSDGRATASCQTTVSVVDSTAPTLTCSAARGMLWPPNHELVNVGFTSRAADACDASIVPAVQVFADEDDEEQTGDGRHSPDAKTIASGSLRLRSERKGNADGRVYLMLTQGTDDSGNTGHQCCAVTVPHSQSRKDKDDVLRQASAAVAACQATGAPPPGFVKVGDGPILGPKQ